VNAEQLLEQLTEPQQEAVRHIDGPLLVLAGAGSGKTRVVTYRVAYLIAQGIAGEHILAVTFTNKAAGEMRSRISQLLDSLADGDSARAGKVTVGTFHAFCTLLLRRYGWHIGLQPHFTIPDEGDRLKLLKEAMKNRSNLLETLTPAKVCGAISLAKNQLAGPDELEAVLGDNFRVRMIAQIYRAYEQLLEQANALDFDDLLLKALKLLGDQELRDHVEDIHRYVLIDEYQDTNRVQYLIAKKLTQQRRNLCATGDPDQSIYGWRGADLRNILQFEQDFPDAKVVRLEQNYRSTRNILRSANALIQHNKFRKDKKLWTANPEGPSVELLRCEDEEDEARKIADLIEQMHRQGRPLNHFAVFCRINSLLKTVETELNLRSLPYQLARGVGFYQRREIRDALAYLRVLANPADRLALERIINTPTRGIGAKAQKILQEFARTSRISLYEAIQQADRLEQLGKSQQNVSAFAALLSHLAALPKKPVAALIQQVLDQTGLRAYHAEQSKLASEPEDELEQQQGEEQGEPKTSFDELVNYAEQFDKNYAELELEDFLAQSSLASEVDSVDSGRGAVMLMTLHAAKGLEFPVVFMMALEDGVLPHALCSEDPKLLEEERRSMFVGMTRAQEKLYLSYALTRTFRGKKGRRSVPSRFLRQIDTDAVAGLNRDDFEVTRRTAPFVIASRPGAQRSETAEVPKRPKCPFKAGQRVYHDRFGHGRIESIQLVGNEYMASVQFRTSGLRKLALRFAPLHLVKLDE